jgi:O-antigen/teichoic acid export membrane protein
MHYGRYATSVVAEAALKLGATVAILLLVWRDVNGAVFAIVAAALGGLLINTALSRFLPRPRGPVAPISHPYRYSLLTLASLTLLALMLSVDVLAAKRYLDPDTAGLYAAVSLSGKIVFFATSALSLVLFPWFSSRRERGLDAKAGLQGGLGLIAGISVVLVATYFLVPELVVRPLFGSEYLSIDGYLGWMAIAFAFYAIAYMSATYLLSQASLFGAYVLAFALAAQLAGLYALHGSITQIIAVQAGVFAAAALILGGYSARLAASGRPSD